MEEQYSKNSQLIDPRITIRRLLKKIIWENKEIQNYFLDEDRIDIGRTFLTQFNELPLINISTPEEDSDSINENQLIERLEVKVLIQIYLKGREKLDELDQIGFLIRNLIRKENTVKKELIDQFMYKGSQTITKFAADSDVSAQGMHYEVMFDETFSEFENFPLLESIKIQIEKSEV